MDEEVIIQNEPVSVMTVVNPIHSDTPTTIYTTPVSLGFFPRTPDMGTVFLVYYTLTILFFITAYFAAKLPFYSDLSKKFPQNSWLIASLWIVASLISYAAFYLVRGTDPHLFLIQRLWIWFLVTNYLNILWAVLFYLYQSFTAALILVFIIMLVYFYLMILLFPVNFWAALSLLPLFILYGYLLWSLLHLMGVNGIVI